MTPAPPLTLLAGTVPSPVGPLGLVWDDAAALRALEFDGYDERRARLLGRVYGEVRLREAPVPKPLATALADYFDGRIDALDALPSAALGTPFRMRVWAALRTIAPGETLSYGALAARIGQATASRAVGLANGANPVAIVVPCHRVVGADGRLTGFGGGLERKRWLLEHEARHAGLFAPRREAVPAMARA